MEGYDDTCKRLDMGSEHFILPFTVLVRYFESKPGLNKLILRIFESNSICD